VVDLPVPPTRSLADYALPALTDAAAQEATTDQARDDNGGEVAR
jgi:hypothetical protein